MQEASDLEREWSASKAPKLSAGRKRGKCSSASDLRSKAAKLHYQPGQHRKQTLTPVHPEVLFDADRNLTDEPDTEEQPLPAYQKTEMKIVYHRRTQQHLWHLPRLQKTKQVSECV